MNKEYVQSVLKSCVLFSELSDASVTRLSEEATAFTCLSGDDITSYAKDSLIVIASGSANVFSKDVGSNTLLRILSDGDVFGIAGLLSGYSGISRIIAKSNRLTALSFPKERILSLITEDRDFAKKYISLLEKKIVFLNRRINAFTAGTCERTLATFLCSVSSEEQFEVGPIAFSNLAMQLNMGRASFYRALETFEQQSIVRRGQKTIFVISRSLLKEKYLQ